MDGFVIVLVTVGSPEEGTRLAQTLVEDRLAACVNRVRGVRSIYRWQGRVEESDEELLVIKTHQRLFHDLKKKVQELHSYTEPEIIAISIVDGSEGYLKWLEGQLKTGGK
jgi:periplasmic divalent cation tolerance protein